MRARYDSFTIIPVLAFNKKKSNITLKFYFYVAWHFSIWKLWTFYIYFVYQ